ncbi:MAG: VanZ family protein [Acidobacteria bacterium]|nr:VanZ family protein [Acidobacteriota bacterium]
MLVMMLRHKPSEDTLDRLQSPGIGADKKQLGLGWGLLSYFCSITLLITLTPFRFHWPASIPFLWAGGWFDAVCNVLLFLPLGFFYRLTRKTPQGAGSMQVFGLGLCLSATIEITQLFLPGRYASPTDVLTNGFGGWLGSWLCDRAQRLLNRQWMGRLALELPLMNIVYLLVPLIWLNGLAAGGDWSRSRLAWLLGLCGSVVLAGVYQNGMKPAGRLQPGVLALVAAGWFLLSSVPAFLESASTPLYGSGLAGLSVCLLVALPAFSHSSQRRFEIPVLKRVWPLYAAYLLLLSLWPVPSNYLAWRGAWGLVELADEPGVIPILRLTEHFAAFTLLGYMVAESHGRREVSQTTSIVWSCFWCGLAAALLEAGRGFHPSHAASLAQGLLSFTGSVYGAVIYWLQLSSVRRLLGRPRGRDILSGSAQPLQ